MRKWLLPAIGVATVGAVAAVGAIVFNSNAGSAQCDRDALAETMRARIVAAEREGASQMTISMPAACHDDDMMRTMPEVSRSWHVMEGGMMMRQMQHTEP